MPQTITTRTLPEPDVPRLRALMEARGHTLRTNPKNRYIAFEARTDGKSIFTLYTSGKLVSTVREGDAEGLLVEEQIAALAGEGATAGSRVAAPAAAEPVSREGIAWLAGADETGTGEIIGTSLLAAACLPASAARAVHAVAGAVETKTSRAASGWEKLGQQLAGLRGEGLVLSLLPVSNRLFDGWSKNGLLDVAYVRLVADLIAAAGLRTHERWDDLQLVIDDYGVGAALRAAARQWTARGARLQIMPKADDKDLATRTASVWARSARAREMQGLKAQEDLPIGTGNPGHRETKRWLSVRAKSGLGWPSFVKASFKTVRVLDGMDPVEKERMPALSELLDEDGVASLLSGVPDPAVLRVLVHGEPVQRIELDVHGKLPGGGAPPPAIELLPVLAGPLVLDDDLPLETLDALLDRETGLASTQRILVGPALDPDDAHDRTLLAAHMTGAVHLQPTDQADADERAAAHAGLRVTRADVDGLLHVKLRD